MLLPLILTVIFVPGAHASIFDKDDRIDTKFASAELQALARSVPALVQKDRIKALPDGRLELSGRPMLKFGLCPDEAFAEELNIANCSASLIAKNKVLTAAHCFDQKAYHCNTYSVVFDYQRIQVPMAGAHILDQSQVYQCKRVIYTKFDESITGVDLAIIELDRDVEGREPVELELAPALRKNDPLFMIGYPMGISQKVVEEGKVLSVDAKNVSFKNDLDTFSVNSGGPIFSKDLKQVGVLVRGTGPNLSDKAGRGCLQWDVAGTGDFSEGNDLSPLAGLGL